MTGSAITRYPLPLRVSDFVGLHVNNVRFQEFSQEARLLWFREYLVPEVPDSRVPYALVRWMEIDFRNSIPLGAIEVWADVEVLKIGRTSFTMRTSIGSPTTGGEPCAVIDSILVVTAEDEKTTLEVPAAERAILQAAMRQVD